MTFPTLILRDTEPSRRFLLGPVQSLDMGPTAAGHPPPKLLPAPTGEGIQNLLCWFLMDTFYLRERYPHSCLPFFFSSHFSEFPGGSDGKEPACNARDLGLIPGLGRSPGGGNGNPLQYSCLENSMDRRVWWTTVHGVAKSQTY